MKEEGSLQPPTARPGHSQSPTVRTPGFLSPHCVFSLAPSKFHLDVACFLPLALTGTVIPLRLDTGDQTVIWAVPRTAEAKAATQPQRPWSSASTSFCPRGRGLWWAERSHRVPRPAALDGGFLAGPQDRGGPWRLPTACQPVG